MTLGVELELQLLDAETGDLSPAASRILEIVDGGQGRIKPELFQAMLEINTGICHGVQQVRRDLEDSLAILAPICEDLHLRLASAGSHPFARYSDRLIYPADRYQRVLDRNRWLARRLMIFGLHVHVGMRDGPHAAAMTNAMLPYLPHLLALSASSPYWQGDDTGLASARIAVFEAVPTAGHPCTFHRWEDFESLYAAMVASRAITSVKDIWWDIRPQPDFGTVEVRICDGPPTLSETIALAALIQSLFRWFDEQYQGGHVFQPPPDWILRENKWRASRWGLEADVVIDEKGQTARLRREVETLLSRLEPTAAALGCGEELQALQRMSEQGCSHERQRRVFERSASLQAVTDSLAREFTARIPLDD